jgi:hypothetical protein
MMDQRHSPGPPASRRSKFTTGESITRSSFTSGSVNKEKNPEVQPDHIHLKGIIALLALRVGHRQPGNLTQKTGIKEILSELIDE